MNNQRRENCYHSFGQGMIEHDGISHPGGEQFCFNCKKTFQQILDSELEQCRKDTVNKIREEIKNLYQDTRPLDVITGEPVETYGYEETHNQALKQALSLPSLSPNAPDVTNKLEDNK